MLKQFILCLTCLGLTLSSTWAKTTYDSCTLEELIFTEKPLPKQADVDEQARSMPHQKRQQYETFLQPYVVTTPQTEIYLAAVEGNRRPIWRIRQSMASNVANTRIHVCTQSPPPITGTIYLPKPDWSGMEGYTFEVPTKHHDHHTTREAFLTAKKAYYRHLQNRDIPGAAWFRYQASTSRDVNEPLPNNQARRRNRETELQRTFDLFSGGRALSENLQLDRELRLRTAETSKVALDSLPGIRVAEINWQPIVKDLTPAHDPLAVYIPADQHVLFFPSFSTMTDLVDEAKAHGTPILQLLDPRSEDALTHERYERQLCLSLDTWARALGPTLIQSLAMTGSDPYLRTGSDVALLFESTQTTNLQKSILLQYQRAKLLDAQVRSVSGTLLNQPYQGVITTDRSISSYLVTWDNTVVVTNSLAQLKKILKAKQRTCEALVDLDEYTFFRDRYPRHEPESALLIITDATIRRWCGPRWRIAASRRVRAGAHMAHLQAKHLESLVTGLSEDQRHLASDAPLDMGEISLTRAGIRSTRYGSLDFQTPILELDFNEVTQTEADAYQEYRSRYQRRWQQFFDPIAIRFHVTPDSAQSISVDLTVRPLIASTQYQRFIDLTNNQGITDKAGDPHPEALGQLVVSIDRNADQIQRMGAMAATFAPGLQANPLSWLGDWFSVYVDSDGFWQEYQAVAGDERKVNEFMENNLARLPIALHVDVDHSLKLTGFMVALRSFIEQTAPKMTIWDNLYYQDQPYVRIQPSEQIRSESRALSELSLYYLITPKSLVVSLSEPIIQRAIDRMQAAKSDNPPPSPNHHWLGKNMAVHIQGPGMTLAQNLYNHNTLRIFQERSWANLIILNEWHQRFSGTSALDLHQTYWQTRLVCPGGGQYIWNTNHNSMESTVFGCPAHPKTPQDLPTPLNQIKELSMGLTFEENGLRARTQAQR